MILRIALMLLMIGGGSVTQKTFDKQGFYAVMASGRLREIDNELEHLEGAAIAEKEAYEGALLMKKAGLLALPKDKLKSFRLGCTRLETAISRDSTNGEYRFLRLSIQENAPRIVKYNGDLGKDKAYIHLHFKGLSPVVQDAIREYSRHSRILSPENQYN
jgi:hypothetical protein